MAPAYAPHTLVAFGGTLNTAADVPEIWQCGVRVTDVIGGGPLADHDAYLAGVHVGLAAWFAENQEASAPYLSTLAWIKANPIKADGKYAEDVTHLYDYPAPVLGGCTALQDANPFPDVLCVALSWTTDKARGKSHAGRIYPPTYAVHSKTLGSMRIGTQLASDFSNWGAALLHAISDGAVKCVPIIASSSGPTAHITGVRVGDVIDVQRRRKSALKEAYSRVPYAPL